MPLSDAQRAFVEEHRGAAMITLRDDGSAHAVRVGVVLVDGKLWSSGTRTRRRTRHLRRDPRATLFYWDEGFGYLSLDTRVTVIDGPQVPELSLRLFQTMQSHLDNPAGQITWNGQRIAHDAFRQAMVDEQRLIYEFDVLRAAGLTELARAHSPPSYPRGTLDTRRRIRAGGRLDTHRRIGAGGRLDTRRLGSPPSARVHDRRFDRGRANTRPCEVGSGRGADHRAYRRLGLS
jgi:hypothetical protein